MFYVHCAVPSRLRECCVLQLPCRLLIDTIACCFTATAAAAASCTFLLIFCFFRSSLQLLTCDFCDSRCAPKVMDVNLRSIFFTCKAALPYLAAAGRSSIVNISSIQAARGFSGYPGYAATKAGIEGFSRQIAVDYASQGIRVNCVVRTRFCLFI